MTAETPWQRYCSPDCRYAAWAERQGLGKKIEPRMTPEEAFENTMELRRKILSSELAEDPVSVRMLRRNLGLES